MTLIRMIIYSIQLKPTITVKFAGLLKSLKDQNSIQKIIREMIFANLPLNKKSFSFLRKLSFKLNRMYVNIFDESLASQLFEYNRQNGINIPSPTFWKLIPKKLIHQNLIETKNPLFQYTIEFSDDKFLYLEQMKDLTIMEQTKESLDKVCEFLKHDSLNYI